MAMGSDRLPLSDEGDCLIHEDYINAMVVESNNDVSDRIPRLRVFDLKSLENKNL